MDRRQWSDLGTRQKQGLYAVAVVETVLTVAALVDLARRPASGVRGPKAAWVAGAFVQPVGPIAYFVVGRR